MGRVFTLLKGLEEVEEEFLLKSSEEKEVEIER